MGTHDGDTSAANSAQRTIIIEPLGYGPGEWEFDRELAADTLSDLLGTLITLGGVVTIRADRIKVGTLPPDGAGKAPEPLGQTVGLIIGYRTIPALTDEPLTVQAMNAARGQRPRAPEPALDPEALLEEIAAQAGVSVEEARAAIANAPVDVHNADLPPDGDDDEDEDE